MSLETVGQILQATREERGTTINEIALQTNMGRKYLDALETDNYDVFPSQTHILGFIRNYATYLELDPDELIDIYKRTILQETPAPYEELTAPSRGRINPAFLITIISLFLVLGMVFLLLQGDRKRRNTDLTGNDPPPSDRTATNRPSPGNSSSSGDLVSRTFRPGDTYTFLINNVEKRLLFEKITNKTVTVMLMNTRYDIEEGKKKFWDFDGDYLSDLTLQVDRIDKATARATVPRKRERMQQSGTNKQASERGTNADTIKGNSILSSPERVEINLTVEARGFATVNWVKDRQERSSKKMDTGTKISILAKDTLQITVSNPFNLTLNLNNRTLEIDTTRAVVGIIFKWRRRAEDGLYHLEYERVQ